MTYNNLPPQAYTKTDVANAYVWIQSQPDYIRNMATSKEALVALYLQSRRNGNLSLEKTAPVSSKDFQSQLKNLANELSQFEGEKKPEQKVSVPVVSKTFAPTPQPGANARPQTDTQPVIASVTRTTHDKTPAPATSGEDPHDTTLSSQEQSSALPTQESVMLQKTFHEFKARPQNFENPLPSNTSKKTFQFQIDPRSEQIIRSVKAQLNMESEHDIIRMLLVLGFDRIKGLFPGNK